MQTEKAKEQVLHWHTFYRVSYSSPTEAVVDQEFIVADITAAAPTKRLSLLSGNLPAEEETILRSYLSSRYIKDDEIHDEIHDSSIVTSIGEHFLNDISTQVYHKVISGSIINEDNNVNDEDAQFVVCFIIATDSGLELFQEDLDAYSNELSPYLQKCMESVDISVYLKFVETWYDSNILFMERCLKHFSSDLALLICAGFCGDSVIFSPDIPADVKKDIERFLSCCNLSPLFTETCLEFLPSMQDMVALTNGEIVNITSNGRKLIIDSKKSTTFCQECVEALQQVKLPNPLKLRQIVEHYKLKSIQHMNSFKRIIKEAENDHYVLYKAFLFLVTCGNGLVLLHNAKLQNSVESFSSCTSVLKVVEMFIEQLGGFAVLDTIESRNSLKAKLGT